MHNSHKITASQPGSSSVVPVPRCVDLTYTAIPLDLLTLKRRFRRILGSSVEFDLAPYTTRLSRIDGWAAEVAASDDSGLTGWTGRLRADVGDGVPLDQVLDELFALAREASQRVLGTRPFDEQIVGGLAMHDGKIAEMQTGEGKTLAAVAPVALNALTGRGVHVLTFNDYLARRDADWMGPIYRLLGLSVGHVQEDMPPAERKAAYRCDVTYVTAKEAGFDVLRDGLCLHDADLVHRPFQFALVDEADSILIDEARIPLVIAGPVDEASVGLAQVASVASQLTRDIDFTSDEHRHNVFLTERGNDRVAELFDRGSLYNPENLHLLIALQNALHAECLLERDVDYIVRDGKVELVDDFTGRVAERRRWPDGLQAAIECKERLDVQREGKILGSITVQHFLGTYPRLCGMTATAQPSAEELKEFYGLDIVVVPPHRRSQRRDHEDVIFTSRAAKLQALVTEIARTQHTGRPILVGTASVVESEQLAAALSQVDVECRILNAKNDEAEAAVVAAAGSLGAVTISTNMAGRGTDIKLGGPAGSGREAVAERGGLYVIGANRHESLRVDQQLRGRSGRQGDPGSSRFFLSAEDPIVVRYGIRGPIEAAARSTSHEDPTANPALGREIRRAQRIVEGENLDIRRRLRDYAVVVETHRQRMVAWRHEVLLGQPPLGLLAERCGDRYAAARSRAGDRTMRRVEQRLTMLAIDHHWSNYLASMRWNRDRLDLVGLVGKNPLAEFFREAGAEFDRLGPRIEDQVVSAFEQIEVRADGVDWEQEGLLGPSSTWTYLVNDQSLGTNVLRDISNRPGVALWAVLFAGPILFLWGLREHWMRRGGSARPAGPTRRSHRPKPPSRRDRRRPSRPRPRPRPGASSEGASSWPALQPGSQAVLC